MTEFEQKLIKAMARTIKDDNADLQALTDKVMAQVRAYCDKHKKEYKALTDFQKERLTNANFILSQVSRFKYTTKQLNTAIDKSLKRVPGNLADESRREDLYNVLANLNFKCIYSDTLLVGGGQKIHLDHIIPVNLGGPTDDWNILPICGSCNSSKSDSHLLDWWGKEHTPQDEYKLVYIFEYMANRLFKSLNTKGVKVVTTLTDEEIARAIELENAERIKEENKNFKTLELEEDFEDEEDVEQEEVKDDKIKRLDCITFLYQMLNHIKQNKQYIISSTKLDESLLDAPALSNKDKQRLIDKKFKKLEKLFNSIYKQNKRLTGAKTDIQLLDEQRKMVEYIKSLDVVSYYHISYTYFDELQQMLDQGKTDKEIQEFCNSVDRAFNVDIFIQQLQDFMATHEGKYPSRSKYADKEEQKLANQVNHMRQAKKGKGHYKLTFVEIEKLELINFVWYADIEFDIDKFIKDLQKFVEQNFRYPKADKKRPEIERKLAHQVSRVRQAKKGKGNLNLTEDMDFKLNDIDFAWTVEEESDVVYTEWFMPFCEDLQNFIYENGMYPMNSKNADDREKKLANTIQGIRQAYKGNGKTRLTNKMVTKLDEMHFAWTAEQEPEIEPEWFVKFCKDIQQFIKSKGRYPYNNENVSDAEKKLATTTQNIRQAYKGKRSVKLTKKMIDRLDEMHFAWTAEEQPEIEPEWFLQFCESLKTFIINNNGKYPSQKSKDKRELKMAGQVGSIRKSRKGIGTVVLSKKMIDRLDEMHFAWEGKDRREKVAVFLAEQGIGQGLSV